MEHLQETDDQLRESLEHLLGLSVSSPRTLESSIQSSEETQRHIRHQCFVLKSKLNEKDRTIDCLRAELSMNVKAKKKFAEENQQLTDDRDDLLTQYAKWDNECTLYEHHIEDLMDLGNEAYERAKKAEAREDYLEDEIIKLLEELESFKQVSEGECNENFLIDSLVSSLVNTDEVASASCSFLEAYSGVDVGEKMLKIWDSLNPSTRNILALASEINNLQNDKEILRMNLIKAEEEVTVLCDENNILDKENIRLTNLLDSDGSRSSGSIKSCKSKSSKSSDEKENDFSDAAGLPWRVLSQCCITHSNCNLI